MPRATGGTSAYAELLFALTGDKELEGRIRALERAVQSRICRPAIASAARVLAKAQKAGAAISAEKRAIGSRLVKSTPDEATAKAGVGVGKKRRSNKARKLIRQAGGIPNVTWYILGTDPRYTGQRTWKSGGVKRKYLKGTPIRYRGIMPKHPFVRQATESGVPQAIEAAKATAYRALERLAKG